MKNHPFIKCYHPILVALLLCLAWSCQDDDDDFFPQTHEGDIVLLTMADLKQFYEDGITVVNGDLEIGEYFTGDNSDIVNLEYLSRLTSVEGRLQISHIDISSFKGLHNLESASEVEIRFLPSIENLEYLDKLTTSHLELIYLESLASLEGMNSMESHMDMLEIAICPLLTDLRGMEFLQTAGTIRFTGVGLDSYLGLDNLREVYGSFESGATWQLRNLAGLSSLRFVDHSFLIEAGEFFEGFEGLTSAPQVRTLSVFMTGLSDVKGLAAFGKIENLWLGHNFRLTSLEGLDEANGLKFLGLEGNEVLTDLSALSTASTLEEFSISRMPTRQNLEGLQHMSQLKRLSVSFMEGLNDLSALSQYTHLEQLSISDTPALTSLNGLQNMVSIDGLTINNANNLVDISSLTDCTINDVISLSRLPSLSLDGLPFKVADAMAQVSIFEVPLIKSLEGLENLTSSIGIDISANDALEDLIPLSQLKSANNFRISHNENLLNLDGLSDFVDSGEFFIIENNDRLTDFCGLTSLINGTGFAGNYTVENNAFNPTVADIRSGSCKRD